MRWHLEGLKLALTSNPVLRAPDFSKEFILYTDASGFCIGAVLGQIDDDSREYVVAYSSSMLRGAELHYSITEKECLVVIFAIKYLKNLSVWKKI